MYQVTLYDVDGAVVKVEQFSNHGQAIDYMVAGALNTKRLTNLRGKPVTWELSQRTKKQGLVPQKSVVRQ